MSKQVYELVAACAFGLESVVRRELADLGFAASIGQAGRVHCSGGPEAICRTNLWLRAADRVLIQVAEFEATDFEALFETTRQIEWGRFLPADAAFPVTGRSIRSTLSSVPACQRSVKRAIVDALRRDHGSGELPETGATYKVDVALLKEHAVLTLDTTGRSLHRRGYRTKISPAPLKETLAAAMVLLSFWKPDRPLLDPFCGSGTVAIEAARIGRKLAPGRNREFAAEAWPGFSSDLWQEARAAADEQATGSLENRILASDIDPRVLQAARENAERAGVADDIHFQAQPVQQATTKRRFGCLITNPPYGQRLGHGPGRERAELDALYQTLPDVLRKLPTWSHYFLTAYPGFERVVGRKADRRRKLYNGRIECTYYQFHGPKPIVERRPVASTSVEPGSETAQPAFPEQQPAEQPAGRVVQTYVHASGPAAFGALGDKARQQAELFATRLRKRAKHLRRWPTRRGITCFRLYERDIPEIPLVVDRYEDHLHITEYERPHDRDAAQHGNWLDLMAETAGEALDVPRRNVFLKRRGRQRGLTQHEKVAEIEQHTVVQEGGLKFLVNLSDYVDTGLFLDHRVTRQMVREEAGGKQFLNLFAYTGAFTVYAAAGGAAKTTSVDLSKNYLDWAWQNMRLNGFTENHHRYVAKEAADFVRQHPPGEHYELVVFDPPTFSNSKRTARDWNVQRDAVPLLRDLLTLVRSGGVIYFSTNFRRFKWDPSDVPASEVHEISRQTVPDDFRNRRIHRCWRIVK